MHQLIAVHGRWYVLLEITLLQGRNVKPEWLWEQCNIICEVHKSKKSSIHDPSLSLSLSISLSFSLSLSHTHTHIVLLVICWNINQSIDCLVWEAKVGNVCVRVQVHVCMLEWYSCLSTSVQWTWGGTQSWDIVYMIILFVNTPQKLACLLLQYLECYTIWAYKHIRSQIYRENIQLK